MDDPFSHVVKYINSADISRIVTERVADLAPDFNSSDEVPLKEKAPKPNLIISLVAGAAAGTVVDVALFPLDTIKTRLQSEQGFKGSGAFRGVYKGIVPVLVGSAPASAIFFGSYNSLINLMKKDNKDISDTWVHFLAASLSEILSATVRVPLELLKQRKQTAISSPKSLDILKETYILEGFGGLYRGFTSTIVREIPFAALQFPLWEYFKKSLSRKRERPVNSLETALCGAAAGGISAAVTTPMDVIKTRTMLARNEVAVKYGKLISFYLARDVVLEHGLKGLFAGIVPRVMWITIGGFIYFGIYECMKRTCEEQKLIPMGTQEDPCLVRADELKEMKMRKKILAESAPSYMEDVDWDSRYVEVADESKRTEMDHSERPDLVPQMIDPPGRL